jgi:hypothetical protein
MMQDIRSCWQLTERLGSFSRRQPALKYLGIYGERDMRRVRRLLLVLAVALLLVLLCAQPTPAA